MLRHYVLAGVLGLSASVSHAAFSYNYVEGGFGEIDDGEALFIGGSQQINQNLFVLGSLYSVDPNINLGITGYDGKGFYAEAGLGWSMPLAPQADFFATGQILYADLDLPVDGDDLGAVARAGLRYSPVSQIELEGSAALSDNDLLIDDGFGLSASARYYFMPQLSAAIGYSMDTELDGAFINVRYNLR